MNKKKYQKFYLLSSVLILVCSMALSHGAYPNNILPTDAYNSLIPDNPDIIILDVRTTQEFNTGYINGAISIPVSQLTQRLGELDTGKTILVYCASGGRSSTAANTLITNGFDVEKVYNLQGGITAWKNAHLPIVLPNQVPSVTITYPLDSMSLTGSVEITGIAQDLDGDIHETSICIDGGVWIPVNGTSTWSYVWDTLMVENGSHMIYARSFDGSDYSEIESVMVTVLNQNFQHSSITVTPVSFIASPNQTCIIDILINPVDDIAGVQFDLSYNATYLRVDSVIEGDFFTGYSTFFNPGIIDNTLGKVTGVYNVIINPDASVSIPGILAHIHFTTKLTHGISTLNLSNVMAGDCDALPISLSVFNGSVTVNSHDTEPPVSQVHTISPYGYHKKNLPLAITATASDEVSGIKEVYLYYRYSSDNSTWTNWQLYGESKTLTPYTWLFSAPNGVGYYEFSSQAIDNADNTQTDPLTADALCQIHPDWDVNKDHKINILDIIIIGQYWETTGEHGWISADVTNDGHVNILDIILIGQHWTG